MDVTPARWPITPRLDMFLLGLREARQDAGLTCAAVARGIGVTPTSLIRWELGHCAPSHAALATWAALLGAAVPEDVRGRPQRLVAEHGTYARAIYDRRRGATLCVPCRAIYLEKQLFYSARRQRIRKAAQRVQQAQRRLREVTP